MSVFFLLVVRFGGCGSDGCGADEQARTESRDVLARHDGGRLTTAAAADPMRRTRPQTHRPLKRYDDGGAVANRTAAMTGQRGKAF
jgi:hypothetical protein